MATVGPIMPAAPARFARAPPIRWTGGLRVALVVLMAVLVLALLGAFHRLASDGVERGESRQRANAALQQAIWQCRLHSDSALREACKRRLQPVPRDNAKLGA